MADTKAPIPLTPYVVSGTQWVTECPGCHHPAPHKFYIDQATGLHLCFRCGYGKGAKPGAYAGPRASSDRFEARADVDPTLSSLCNLDYLRQSQATLWDTKEGRFRGLDYVLNRRGLARDVVRLLGYGYDPARDWLVLPWFDELGRLRNIKWRVLDPRDEESPRYLTARSGVKLLGGMHLLKGHPSKEVVICEGELNAAAFMSCVRTTPAVWLGAKGNWDPKWARRHLDRFERITLALDNEVYESNEDELEEMVKSLGAWRCTRLAYPQTMKDVNDILLQAGSPKATSYLQAALAGATPYGRPLLLSTGDAVEKSVDFYSGINQRRISTGHHALDAVTGGFRPGAVYTFAGPAKKGKTTMALDWAMNVAAQGIPVLFGSFEMKVSEEMLPRMVSKYLRRNVERQRMDPAAYQRLCVEVAQKLPWTWINRHDRVSLRELYESVKHGYAAGARFLVLDHLQFIMDFGSEEVFKATAKVSRFIKRLSNDFPELTVLGISQIAGGKFEIGKYKQDTQRLMGGSTQAYNCDEVWWYEDSVLTVQQTRTPAITAGGRVVVQFNPSTCTYNYTPVQVVAD